MEEYEEYFRYLKNLVHNLNKEWARAVANQHTPTIFGWFD